MFNEKGQSLVEILVAIGVGAILIGGAVGVISPILKSNLETKNIQVASSLAQQYLDNLRNIAEADWSNIYNPPALKGSDSQFYLSSASSTYIIISGSLPMVVEGRNFAIHFSVENVNRDSCGAGNITEESVTFCSAGPGSAGIADDPSTQKITVSVSWVSGGFLSRSEYFTRSKNAVFVQTDWSGGAEQEGPITSENGKFASSTNINFSTTTGAIKIQGL